MPALPSVPQVVRIEFIYSNSGVARPAKVREYWHYTGPAPSNADCVALATALQTGWGTDIKPHTHSTWELDTVTITDLTSATGSFGAGTGATQAGALTGDPIPIDTCFLMVSKVARRYRGGHPRQYWPMGDATYMGTEEHWNPTDQANMQSGVVALHALIAGASLGSATFTGRVNVSFYEGFHEVVGSTGRTRNANTPRTSAVVDPITSESGADFYGVQRRRRGRV